LVETTRAIRPPNQSRNRQRLRNPRRILLPDDRKFTLFEEIREKAEWWKYVKKELYPSR